MLLLASLIIGFQSTKTPDWVINLLTPKSPPARSLPETGTKKNESFLSGLDKGEATVDGRVGTISEAELERFKASRKAVIATMRLLQQSRFESAFEYIRAFRVERSDLWLSTRRAFIPCALVTKRYDEALPELLDLARQSSAPDWTWLKISLATAAAGKTYPGQFEYCEETLAGIFAEEYPGAKFIAPTTNRDSQGITLTTLVALGMLNMCESSGYLEQALAIDPKCSMAALELISRYFDTGQYSQMRRIAREFLAHDPSDGDRLKVNAKLEEASGLADLPLQLIPFVDN